MPLIGILHDVMIEIFFDSVSEFKAFQPFGNFGGVVLAIPEVAPFPAIDVLRKRKRGGVSPFFSFFSFFTFF